MISYQLIDFDGDGDADDIVQSSDDDTVVVEQSLFKSNDTELQRLLGNPVEAIAISDDDGCSSSLTRANANKGWCQR